MEITRRTLLGTGPPPAPALALPRLSRAQAANTIRIGVMNDHVRHLQATLPALARSPARSRRSGIRPASGFNVEVIFADHQNKPDIGANIARQWYDPDGVDMILDVPTSSAAWRCRTSRGEEQGLPSTVGSATSDLTGAQCTPNTIHWAYDTYMLAKSTGGAMVKAGGDTLVLHHRRLRLRPCAGARHHRLREGGGRQGARRSVAPLPGDHRFLLLPAAGPGGAAPRSSASPMPAPTPSTAIKQAAEFGITGRREARGAADVHHRRACARPADRRRAWC